MCVATKVQIHFCTIKLVSRKQKKTEQFTAMLVLHACTFRPCFGFSSVATALFKRSARETSNLPHFAFISKGTKKKSLFSAPITFLQFFGNIDEKMESDITTGAITFPLFYMMSKIVKTLFGA